MCIHDNDRQCVDTRSWTIQTTSCCLSGAILEDVSLVGMASDISHATFHLCFESVHIMPCQRGDRTHHIVILLGRAEGQPG